MTLYGFLLCLSSFTHSSHSFFYQKDVETKQQVKACNNEFKNVVNCKEINMWPFDQNNQQMYQQYANH